MKGTEIVLKQLALTAIKRTNQTQPYQVFLGKTTIPSLNNNNMIVANEVNNLLIHHAFVKIMYTDASSNKLYRRFG